MEHDAPNRGAQATGGAWRCGWASHVAYLERQSEGASLVPSAHSTSYDQSILRLGTPMAIFTLKTIRFFVPAILVYMLAVLFCWVSDWCSLAVPESYETFAKSIIAAALGAIYYALPLRECANQAYFDRVNRNLVYQLTLPFIHDPNFPRDLTWRQVRRVFYPYVDNDKSLGHLKVLAFWNGAVWTSAADLRMVSGIGVIFFAFVMLVVNLIGNNTFGNARGVYAILLLLFLFLMSIVLSELTTRRHIRIGTQQAEQIRLHHRAQLRAQLIQARSST